MSVPVNSTTTPPRGMSAIAARLLPAEGRHRVDPTKPGQWHAADLVGDRTAKVVDR